MQATDSANIMTLHEDNVCSDAFIKNMLNEAESF